jgi:CHASE3 domain sensor protein
MYSGAAVLKTALFNEHVAIRTQILVSFSVVVIISVGVTLAICYGLMFAAGENAYNTASTSIIANTQQSVLSNALDISAAVNQQLLLVGLWRKR